MSPLGNPCPKLIEREGIYLCSDYQNRPKQCKNHKFDSRFCPIGLSLLKISLGDIQERLMRAEIITGEIDEDIAERITSYNDLKARK